LAVAPNLESVLVRALLQAWHGFNRSLFAGRLRAPVIELTEREGQLGCWHPSTRTLSLQRGMVRTQPWGVTLEVLKHEMAHQYVHEALGATHETAHGPAFRDTCARLGIDLRATGTPDAGAADPAQERIARRIGYLLALAESPNEHEARAAMDAARKLLLTHNLAAPPTGYAFRQIGTPSARVPLSERFLANLLSEHFFVEVIWVHALDPATGREGRVIEACGTPSNLDMAVYVHAFVRETAWRLWKAHKAVSGARGDRERERFTAGVVRGFAETLAEGARQSREEGLVWVGDAGVTAYVRKRHPRVRTVRFGGGLPSDTHEQGRAAGRGIVLRKPIAEGPSRTGAVPRIGGS
jgi:hypothetical protein